VVENDFWKVLSSKRSGVARIRYFRDRKIVSFHPTEDVRNIGAPKYVFDYDNKCSFSTDSTGGEEFGKSEYL